jgi:hypothetical protein
MRFIAGVALMLVGASVNAATITFGETYIDRLDLAGPQIEGDYTYQAFGEGWEIQEDEFGNPPAALVTFWNDEGAVSGDYVDLYRTDGDTFYLQQLDYWSRDPEYRSNFVTVTGYQDGSIVGEFVIGQATIDPFLTVTSSFGGAVDLLRLSVSGGGSATTIDNIALTAVPVPAAVWLFGSALAGLGWFRRKTG